MEARVRIEPARSPTAFLDAQRAFYVGDPHYVPPLTLVDKNALSPRHNPFFARAEAGFWLGWRGREVVGRISAVRNMAHDEFWGDTVGFFGHFEARDAEAATAMLAHARGWLGTHGATSMRGPIDLSTNSRTGLLVEGDPGPPAVMMPYNPATYGAWIEGAGLRGIKDVVAFHIDTRTIDAERLRKLGARVAERARVRLRPIAMRSFRAEIGLLWDLYNQILERNWGFVPMSRGEFEREAKDFKAICVPELIQIAEVEGRPVGFIVALPDANRAVAACNGRLLPFGWWRLLRALRTVTHLRVVILGVLPDHRGRGIDAALIQSVVANGVERGFTSAECGWVLEDNSAMTTPLLRLGARAFRRYRVYETPA